MTHLTRFSDDSTNVCVRGRVRIHIHNGKNVSNASRAMCFMFSFNNLVRDTFYALLSVT